MGSFCVYQVKSEPAIWGPITSELKSGYALDPHLWLDATSKKKQGVSYISPCNFFGGILRRFLVAPCSDWYAIVDVRVASQPYLYDCE